MNYIVTDRGEAGALLQLLSPVVSSNLQIITTDGMARAEYLARSIAAVKRNPVAIVADAAGNDYEETRTYMAGLAHPYLWRIFFVKPTVEFLLCDLPSFCQPQKRLNLERAFEKLSVLDLQEETRNVPLIQELRDFFQKWKPLTTH
jgi:hypothetical protein